MSNNTTILWEENDLIEPKTKSENSGIIVPSDITNDIKMNATERECSNIGIKKEWKKDCPNCGGKQQYSKKEYLQFAIKNNLLCQSCCKIGKQLSEKTKQLLRYYNKLGICGLKNKHHSEETKRKMRLSRLSKSISGKNHPMFGKKGEHNPLFGRKLSDDHKEKISKSIKGTHHTLDHNRKIRISTLNVISKYKLSGKQLSPRYNSDACRFFDKLNEEKGWSLQHAMNVGEFYIKELGYWLDGYDAKKNIIVEYDEKFHNRPFHIKKDLIRQNEIINYLHPKEFWRFNVLTKELIQIL